MQISNEKAHYESLIALFKFTISVMFTLFAAVAAVVALITYGNGKEMREELRAQKAELNDVFVEQREKLDKKEAKLDAQLATLSASVNERISITREDAIAQIGSIKTTASIMAESEARKKVGEVFDNKNFDEFVAKIAKERMEPQISELVDNRIIASNYAETQKAVENLKSDDPQVKTGSISYLQNIYVKISDDQLKEIITVLDNKDFDDYNRQQLQLILVYRKSPACTEYYKHEFISTFGDVTTSFAITYFSFHNIEEDFIIDNLYTFIKDQEAPFYVFSNAFIRIYDNSKSMAIHLLNAKKIIDYISTKNADQITSIKHDITDYLSGRDKGMKDISTTYLFTK